MENYLLQSYLDDCWSEHPEKTALVDDRTSVTYAQLHEDSNRIANCLAEYGVERQDRVIVCLGRSPLVVVAILGTLKADAVYVPMDNKSPVERLVKIIDDCRPSALVCDQSLLRVIDGIGSWLSSLRLILVLGCPGDLPLDAGLPVFYWGDGNRFPTTARRYRNIDVDPAYILYTSGSTGIPKGVVVSHLNVISYIEWAVEYFRIRTDERILNTAPFQFDMSTFDIFATLKVGATLCVAPDRFLLFPQQLLGMIEHERVTLWKGVSSLLMYLSATGCLREGRIPSLRKVLFGGEVLPTKHLMAWIKTYPDKEYYNVYGPTEATGISACHRVERAPETADEAIPIGTACANTELLLLAEDGGLAAVGEIGELCIRGSGLSLGYWNDNEKTVRAFIRNPFGWSSNDRIYRTGDLARMGEDGVFHYLGRKDFQVKVMGHRVEILEIEQALLALEYINHAAVVLGDSLGDVAELVAFVECLEAVATELIHRDLCRVLPSYMMPTRIILLPQIPMTDRGKTDRNLLQHYSRGFMPVKEERGFL